MLCFGLGLSAAVAVGLGRFAYALVLPAMQEALGWSYAQAGSLNAANSAGYLLGAIAAGAIAKRVGLRAAFAVGSIGCAITLLATALPRDLFALLVLRFAPGVLGAIAFVVGGVLVARVAAGMGSRASVGIGLFYTGPGVGMVLAGVSVPPLLAYTGDWRYAWLALGSAACLAAIIAVGVARRVDPHGPLPETAAPSGVPLTAALVSYLFFAAGYIGYMTFIIATVRERGTSAFDAALWWLLMGVAAIVSFWIWRRALAAADGRALASLNALCAGATLLPLLHDGPVITALSVVLFAGTFLVIVALTTNMARLARAPAEWPRWIGYFTVAFGLGQTIGPLAGGFSG